jgi:hypothetical protein
VGARGGEEGEGEEREGGEAHGSVEQGARGREPERAGRKKEAKRGGGGARGAL